MTAAATVHRVDAEDLELGGGLEVLLQAALAGSPSGAMLEVALRSRSSALELPTWARLEGHQTLDVELDAGEGHLVRLQRGPGARVLADALPSRGEPPRLGLDGGFGTAAMRTVTPPRSHDPAGGLAPLGSVPESGAPPFSWRLHRRDAIWAAEVGDLVDQAKAQQWDAATDVPWEAAAHVPEVLERAVAQVMTFIAQNEYAALYVPAQFLPQVHPRYAEVVMWLAGHVHDEARHVEVFTKRALIGGHQGYALASTELSLRTLMDEPDFGAASLLLNVLGEGTFLDLLRFVERHSPDAATATAARLAHRDERRHVHFGVAHVRQALAADPDRRAVLVDAAVARASRLTELSGLSPLLTEGLTIMAAGSMRPAALSEGARAVRELMLTMERNRIRRLRAAGFDAATARTLSDMHTPNLM
jgi:TusA-related sulfurtransferase